MTQEDKELLLKDLCARLPYNVVINNRRDDSNYNSFLTTDMLHELQSDYQPWEYKPYLRPLSSMTEEEWKECEKCYQSDDTTTATLLIDFYNKKMFDYRGLIPMGLALEALEGMYNITK